MFLQITKYHSVFMPLYMCHIFFIHSSVDVHLDCFYVLIIVHDATMSTGVHISCQVSLFIFFWLCTPEWNCWKKYFLLKGARKVKNQQNKFQGRENNAKTLDRKYFICPGVGERLRVLSCGELEDSSIM